jgi:hypothetical protein
MEKAMKLSKKLYKVQIGLSDDGEGNEVSNWEAKTVIATHAGEAITKARLGKKEFAESVTCISEIDVS